MNGPGQTSPIAHLFDSFMNQPGEYGIMMLDENRKILMWNKGAEKMFGWTAAEMVGKPCPFPLSHRGLNPDHILFGRVTHEEGTWAYDSMLSDQNGRTFPVHISIISHGENESEHLMVIMKDTTVESHQDRLRNIIIEVAHLANQPKDLVPMLDDIMRLLRTYLEIPLSYVCLSEDGTHFQVVSANGLLPCGLSECCHTGEGKLETRAAGCMEACTQLVISHEPLFDHRISDCIEAPQTIREPIQILHVPLLSDVAILGVLHVAIPDRLIRTYLEDSQVLSLIANKLTASIRNKQLEKDLHEYAEDLERIVQMRTDQLREKDAQLVQSGKLATLGEMATGVAHEINQPLGGISLMAQGIQRALDKGKLTDDLLRDRLISIQEQIERINKIINHLRVFGRQAPEAKTPIHINKPLRDVLDLIGMQLQNHNIQVELSLDDTLPEVLADSNRLEQVFLNIIGNARDALEEQSVRVSDLRQKDNAPEWTVNWNKRITIRTFLAEGLVSVAITDTAGGIPEQVLNKIFEPFFTTKQVGKGTGLGLSISYGIMKEFNGDLLVRTEKDKGSTFIAMLPPIDQPAGGEESTHHEA